MLKTVAFDLSPNHSPTSILLRRLSPKEKEKGKIIFERRTGQSK